MANQDFTLLVGAKVDTKQVEQQLNTISKKTSVTVKVNAKTNELETLKTVTTKSTDAMGNLVTSVTKFNKEGTELGTVVSGVNEKIKSSNKSIKELASDFVDTTGKVAKFGASTAVIGVFYSAIQEAKEQVATFDNSLAELRKVTDLSGESLNNFKQEAFDLAEQLSTTASNVMDATTEFSKSGFSLEDSKTMAEQALIFKTVADGEISAADAATTLIQVTKAYNMTAEESQHIVDALNEV